MTDIVDPFDAPKIVDPFDAGAAPAAGGMSFHVPAAIRDIPAETYNQFAGGLKKAGAAFNPFSEENRQINENESKGGFFDLTPQLERGKLYASGLGGLAEAAGSWLTGPATALGGHALAPANDLMRRGAVALYGEDKIRQTEAATGLPVGGGNYETAKQDVASMLPALAPGRGGLRAPLARGPAPTPPTGDMLDVMLSQGQRTGDLPTIRREQAALRGQLGTGAEDQAKAFAAQQGQQVETAAERIRQGFDPYGQTLAETPHDAGALVSQGIQSEAARAKAGVTAAYDAAKALPGEIEANAFDGIGTRIKDALSSRADPVVIDDKLTPYASRAIQDVDDRITQLQIQNRASPTGQPPRNQIAGVTLEGVDQMRKRLSAFRKDAYSSGNAADGRAARAVLDAFDDHIDQAIKGGQFTGDQRAIDAWNDARAAHADYRSTFTAQKNDPIGRVVERITGKGNTPAAIPNDVADFLYGSSGVNPNSLNVGVANRVKSILGDQSPEWSGVKQGLFARLTEATPGMTDFGPAKIAQRLNRFLNGDGRELAEAMYSPDERKLLQQYAELNRKLEVPKTGANWSETSTFLAPVLRKIGSRIGMMIGAGAGHLVAPGLPWGVSEAVGAGIAKGVGAIGNVMDARKIAKQMPTIDQATRAYQKALAAHTRASTPLSKRTLAVAATNLANALAPIGIDLRHLSAIQGPTPAAADQDQRQRGGRTNAQPDQGEGDRPGYAAGGRVEPANIDHEPTEAQKKAGNYAKDHVRIHGLDITIENAKGAERRGVDRGGKPWSVKMPAHYGYIKGTVGKDKDHVDVYVGPHLKSPHVFIVDQVDADTRKFDEHKAFIGFATPQQVTRAYHAAFSDGRAAERLGHLREMTVDAFKDWLTNGDTTKPAEHADHGREVVAFKDGSQIGLAQNAPGVHFQCRTCKFNPAPGGVCHNPNPKLYLREIKPQWCCNLYDHPGMKVIV